MSKALRSFQEPERSAVVARRLAEGMKKDAIKGLGFWSAAERMAILFTEKLKKKQAEDAAAIKQLKKGGR